MILLADTVGDGAVTKEVTEATSEAVQEVGKFAEYVNDNIPELFWSARASCAGCIFYWNKNYQAASEDCQTLFTKINGRQRSRAVCRFDVKVCIVYYFDFFNWK